MAAATRAWVSDHMRVVVLDVAVPGLAARDAAQRGQVALLDRGVEVLDGRADLVLLRHRSAPTSRVSSTVPSTATATSAAITSSSAITQPQLRRFDGGLGASPRGGMTCGATGFGIGAGAVAMISVAGSDGVSILVVAPASKPDGAVNRRSGSSVTSAASVAGAMAAMISVAGSWSRSWRLHHLGGGLGIGLLGWFASAGSAVFAVGGFGHLIGDLVRLVRP